MEIMKAKEIEEALQDTERVYLCGDLKRPNVLDNFTIENFEMGITKYSTYTADKPHYHKTNHELTYVLKGEVKILLLDSFQEIVLSKGDLFLADPEEAYTSKAQEGTEVLFLKFPGGNDKIYVDPPNKVQTWSASWDI